MAGDIRRARPGNKMVPCFLEGRQASESQRWAQSRALCRTVPQIGPDPDQIAPKKAQNGTDLGQRWHCQLCQGLILGGSTDFGRTGRLWKVGLSSSVWRFWSGGTGCSGLVDGSGGGLGRSVWRFRLWFLSKKNRYTHNPNPGVLASRVALQNVPVQSQRWQNGPDLGLGSAVQIQKGGWLCSVWTAPTAAESR